MQYQQQQNFDENSQQCQSLIGSEALILFHSFDGHSVVGLLFLCCRINLLSVVKIVILRKISDLSTRKLKQRIHQRIVSCLLVIIPINVLEVRLFDEGQQPCLECLYTSEFLRHQSIVIRLFLSLFVLAGKAQVKLFVRVIVFYEVSIEHIEALSAIEDIQKVEDLSAQKFVISVYQHSNRPLLAMGLYSIDSTLQKVFSFFVPDQGNLTIVILFFEVLLDSIYLFLGMAICDVDYAVFFVILIEDGLQDVLMRIVLFQEFCVDYNAHGELVILLLYAVFLLKFSLLLGEGESFQLFVVFRSFQIEPGQFQGLKVIFMGLFVEQLISFLMFDIFFTFRVLLAQLR